MAITKQLKEFIKNRKKQKNHIAYKLNEEGKAIINIGAENYDDIFSPYCYKGGDTLRAELVDYIEEKAECIPLNTEVEISFRVKNASQEKLNEVTEAFDRNYKTEIKVYESQLRQNNFFSLFILLLGVVFFTIYILTIDSIPFLAQTILEIGTWVFIWEALDSFFLERRMIKYEILKRYRLLYATKTIKEFENYW